jgi:spermidine synthase
MKRALLLLLGALAGYIGLSYEILWVRVYSYLTGGTAASFGVLLGAYLLGLSLGSLASWIYCSERTSRDEPAHLRVPAVLVLAASALGFCLIPLLATLVQRRSFVLSLFLVAGVAGLLGALLPLLGHFGIRPDVRAGVWLSYFYVANIAGSAAGSLLTGFVLLDRLSLRQISVFLALLGAALALLLILSSGLRRFRLALWIVPPVLVAALVLETAPELFDKIYEKLQFKRTYSPAKTFAHIVENRHGVITVLEDGTVYGGGVYDGVYNTSLIDDRNLIVRAYVLSAVHPLPRRVFMIGISSGSFVQVIANNPFVERLTVVEINPGYLKLIPQYPQVASLLRNPKVEIFIDDGRRWLRAHPDRRFDAVVNNTTWHWRTQATNLLSAEFLRLVQRHLEPGGVLLNNTTFSLDAQKTACTVFPYGIRFINHMAVGDSPMAFDRDRWRKVLASYQIDGRPVFDLQRPDHRARFEEVLRLGPTANGREEGRNPSFQTCSNILKWTAENRIVTDDNMATEWYRPWWAMPD